jgi:ABC-2 type transport system permease protein
MKLQRVVAVARKEFIHVVRDPRSLGLGIAIPLLLLFLFGYALTLDVDRVPIMVWDQSGSSASRDFVSRFSGSRYFDLAGHGSGYHELEEAMDRGRIRMALVIPPRFAADLSGEGGATVQLLLDGSDANTATLALGYAEAVSRSFSRDVTLQQDRRAGLPSAVGGIDLRPRVWFNSDMVSRNYIFPGLMAVIMMVIAALLTSLTVAREWETGTMEQLIATPLRASELMAGKLVPYFAIGVLDLVLAVLLGQFAFQVPLRGSLVLLFLLSLLFLGCALSFGLLVSIVTRNQRLASQIAMVTTMLPAFLLSGFIFPIDNMPAPIRVVTHIITARYFVTILRGIYLKGVGLTVLLPEVAFLAVFAVVVVTLALRTFRKKVD